MLDACALAADAVVFMASTAGREEALTTTVARALALGLHVASWKVRASSR